LVTEHDIAVIVNKQKKKQKIIMKPRTANEVGPSAVQMNPLGLIDPNDTKDIAADSGRRMEIKWSIGSILREKVSRLISYRIVKK